MVRHLILATAGHVDHGKSALVQALTSTDPDRLPEEKIRGITIDLGFAELRLTSGADSDGELRIGIIDVPGHEDFVKNMVAGVGCVDLGMIVVAADDGWMPQTEEHLQILEYLGVQRVVVVLNKIDLAPDDREFLEEVIRDELKGSSFAAAPIIATSTTKDIGISELKTQLVEQFDQLPDSADYGKPRLSVDRTFSVKGHGTVVTGSLTGGQMKLDQPVMIQPRGISSRIRALQSFGENTDVAQPGARVAVNLANVAVRRSREGGQEGVGRGDVVTSPEFSIPTQVVDCWVEKSARLVGKSMAAAKSLKQGVRIRVHHGSSNTPGRLYFLDSDPLVVGAQKAAQLRMEGPIALVAGDRFVIRDWSETHTLAGGTVLDALGDVKSFRSRERRAFFERFEGPNVSLATFLEAVVADAHLIREERVLRQSVFGSHEIKVAIKVHEDQGRIFRRKGWVVDVPFWEQQVQLAETLVDCFHRDHCERLGISLSQLRSQLDGRWGEQGAFDVLLDGMISGGLVVEGTVMRRRDHEISMPADLEQAVGRLRAELGKKSTEPPSRKQLLEIGGADRAIRFLVDTGELFELSNDLVFLSSGFQQLEEQVRAYLTRTGGATVSDLRQATGVSRRIMLPLLEDLDQRGVTVREGDLRHLNESR